MKERYPPDLLCKLALEIYNLHYQTDTLYELDGEAEDAFEVIVDRYNGQYNRRFLGKLNNMHK